MNLSTFHGYVSSRRWLLLQQVSAALVAAEKDIEELIGELPDEDRPAATRRLDETVDVLDFDWADQSRYVRLAEQIVIRALDGARSMEEKYAALAESSQRLRVLAATVEGDDQKAVRRLLGGLYERERDLREGGYPWSEESARQYHPTLQEQLDGRLWTRGASSTVDPLTAPVPPRTPPLGPTAPSHPLLRGFGAGRCRH
ncbi:hypothetical protein [Kribbella italica]|uniref:Uncharacterized protein n=1 Tax=Kribbella italica TaxID=1540520 RepID=A0A7W9J7V8_9ACTN|nr:hypothetical protein [Kribbella italica]MBB5836488.1 hypothetical protein [Kribbella italica]